MEGKNTHNAEEKEFKIECRRRGRGRMQKSKQSVGNKNNA